MSNECAFCRLARGDQTEHKTEWFYVGEWGIVVEDLNPKGHQIRLLYVPTKHMPCGRQPPFVREGAEVLLWAVAQAVCMNRDLTITQWDFDHHSPEYKDHWHAQVCLDDCPMLNIPGEAT